MKFKKALLLLSTLTMLASCSSSSYFGKYSFLMGKDKEGAQHFKIELDLTSNRIKRPVASDEIVYNTTIPEPVIFEKPTDSLKVGVVVSSLSEIDEKGVLFETLANDIAQFKNFTAGQKWHDVETDKYFQEFSATLVPGDKYGQTHFSVSYTNDRVTSATDYKLVSVGEALKIDTSFDSPLIVGKQTEIKATFLSARTDVTVKDFYIISTDEKVLKAEFKTCTEEVGGKFSLTGVVAPLAAGKANIAAVFIRNVGEEEDPKYYTILSQYVVVEVKQSASTNSNELTPTNKVDAVQSSDDYYSFTFLIDNSMDLDSPTKIMLNGGYYVKDSGELELDIYFWDTYYLPAEVLSAIIKFKIVTNGVSITIPVSTNDFANQISYVISTGDTEHISPLCKTVTLELAKA